MFGKWQKLSSYVGLVFLSVISSLLAELSRDDFGGYPYNPVTIPLIVESIKICLSTFLLFSGRTGPLYTYVAENCELTHFILFAVPAACYFISNTCMFFIVADIGLVRYHVLGNLKVVFSACAMRVLLGRVLVLKQWIAIFLLIFGMVLAQWQSEDEVHPAGNRPRGYILAVMASAASSAGGVYSEKLLKGCLGGENIHWKNIQLYIWGVLFSIFAVHQTGRGLMIESFLDGYTLMVITMAFLMSLTGIIVSYILKYTDSLSKSLVASLAIVISAFVQIFRGIDPFSPRLFVGASLIFYALTLYEENLSGKTRA
jgi:UDP-sugar transporter A1/2/3